MFGDGGQAALGEGLGRRVVIDEVGMFGAHFLPRRFVQGAGPFVLVAGSSSATYLGGLIRSLRMGELYVYLADKGQIVVASSLRGINGCLNFIVEHELNEANEA